VVAKNKLMNNKKIIAGVMRWGTWGANFTQSQYQETINYCLSNGITHFDHADIYGHYTTEAEFGNAISQMNLPRESYVLITKCGIQLPCAIKPEIKIKSYNLTKQYILNAVHQSLKNLKTDYLDTLLIHRPSPLMQAAEIAEAFEILKANGKVKQFGVSNFTAVQIDYLKAAFSNIEINQIELSYAKNNALQNGILLHHALQNISTMVYSPLADLQNINIESKTELELIAKKHDATIAQILYAWLWHVPHQLQIVIGTSNQTRIAESANAKNILLTNEDWFAILKIGSGVDVA
jgi:predicted oxidoreductase